MKKFFTHIAASFSKTLRPILSVFLITSMLLGTGAPLAFADTLVSGITLSDAGGTATNVVVAATDQLNAVVLPGDATDPTITWNTDDPSVATVDGTGLVTGVGSGTAHITATANDVGAFVSNAITVTVRDADAAAVFSSKIAIDAAKPFTSLSVATTSNQTLLTAAVQSAVDAASVSGATTTVTFSHDDTYNVTIQKNAASDTTSVTATFVQSGVGADVDAVAAAKTRIAATDYTNLSVASTTVQAQLTAAVQAVVDVVKGAGITATVTYAGGGNYNVAIGKNAASDSSTITTATFIQSGSGADTDAVAASKIAIDSTPFTNLSVATTTNQTILTAAVQSAVDAAAVSGATTTVTFSAGSTYNVAIHKNAASDTTSVTATFLQTAAGSDIDAVGASKVAIDATLFTNLSVATTTNQTILTAAVQSAVDAATVSGATTTVTFSAGSTYNVVIHKNAASDTTSVTATFVQSASGAAADAVAASKIAINATSFANLSVATTSDQSLLTAAVQSAVNAAAVSGATTTVTLSGGSTYNVVIHKNAASDTTSVTATFVQSGAGADIDAVAASKANIIAADYTNLSVASTTVQAQLTAAVQTAVNAVKGAGITAMVTYIAGNYSVAINKNAASDSYTLASPTFVQSAAGADLDAVGASKVAITATSYTNLSVASTTIQSQLTAAVQSAVNAAAVSGATTTVTFNSGSTYDVTIQKNAASDTTSVSATFVQSGAGADLDAVAASKVAIDATPYTNLSVATTTNQTILTAAVQSAVDAAAVSGATTTVTFSAGSTYNVAIHKNAAATTTAVTATFLQSAAGADVDAVAAAKTRIIAAVYTNLSVASTTAQAQLTAAVQTAVNAVKGAGITATTTYAGGGNYDVAISKNAANDTYTITTATFVDITPPAPFTVGAVSATGGTVVSHKWNATNTGLTVAVPVANDGSLIGGAIQLEVSRNGAATTTLGTPYVIKGSDVNTTVSLATSSSIFESLAGFSDADSFAFTAVMTDASGNVATGTQSVDTITVDQAAPTVTITGSNAVVLHAGDTYADAGATATDTIDGSLTGSIVSSGLFAGGGAIVASSTGTTTVVYSVSDAAGNSTTTARTIEVYPLSVTQALMATSTTVDVSTPTLVVGSTNTATSTIVVPSNVTNAELDLTALVSSSTATIPGDIAATLSTTLGTVNITIPAGTTITASGGTWDGTVNLPTVVSSTSVTPTAVSGSTAAVSAAIEVGANDVALTFDKAVRILIPGMAGKLAGYSRGGTFTQITDACADDTQVTGDALAPGGACVTTSGSDMVIWTKHFTTFAAYTQTVNPVVSSGGGGGNGAPSSGSVNGLSVVTPGFAKTSASSTPVVVTTTGAPTSSDNSQPQGQVLGAATYNFTKSLAINSTGADVKELQILLTQVGYYKGPVTGTYGALTKAAVMKFQKANKLSQTGSVGPQTRTALNNTLVAPAAAAASTSSTTLTATVPGTLVGSGAVNPAVPVSTTVFTQTLALNATGAQVTTLQQLLTRYGYYKGPITGSFGALTKAAVMKYQKAHQLSQTGTLGPQTRAALNKAATQQ